MKQARSQSLLTNIYIKAQYSQRSLVCVGPRLHQRERLSTLWFNFPFQILSRGPMDHRRFHSRLDTDIFAGCYPSMHTSCKNTRPFTGWILHPLRSTFISGGHFEYTHGLPHPWAPRATCVETQRKRREKARHHPYFRRWIKVRNLHLCWCNV